MCTTVRSLECRYDRCLKTATKGMLHQSDEDHWNSEGQQKGGQFWDQNNRIHVAVGSETT